MPMAVKLASSFSCAEANIKMSWHAHTPSTWSAEGPSVGLRVCLLPEMRNL